MALFGKKKDEQAVATEGAAKDTKKSSAAKPSAAPKLSAGRDLASVIKKPRVTEKAVLGIDRNVYAFEIRQDATKFDVRDAVIKLWNVTPVKVHIVRQQPRHYVSRQRGRSMMDKGLKKAYVYLKKDDRIDLV